MKVYIAYEEDYPESKVIGVFDSRKRADSFTANSPGGFRVEEHELNVQQGKRVRPFWYVAIDLDSGNNVSERYGFDQKTWQPRHHLVPVWTGCKVEGPYGPYRHDDAPTCYLVVASPISRVHAWAVAGAKLQVYQRGVASRLNTEDLQRTLGVRMG